MRLLLFLILVLSVTIANGQNTNSPYSIFGPGEIHSQGFIQSSGMGGAGISLKSGNALNRLNPASYTGIDSLKVISAIGAEGRYNSISTSKSTNNRLTGGLKYLALGYRYNRWWAGSFGISPFSSVGYTIYKVNEVGGLNSEYYSKYVGSGGITQAYLTNSFKISKNLSIGFNTSYMFGSLTQTETIIQTDVVAQFYIVRQDYLKSFYFDFGAQYNFKLKNHNISLGAIFSPEQNLNSRHILTISDEDYSTIKASEENTDYLVVPLILGSGIGIEKQGKYTVAFDYIFQNWSGVDYPIQSSQFVNSHQFAAGVEFAPWEHRAINKAFKNWDYRIGFNYKSSYLKIYGLTIDDKSMSIGLGIPTANRISKIDVAFIIGSRGTTRNTLIKENYALLQVGFSLNEIWFIRRKYD